MILAPRVGALVDRIQRAGKKILVNSAGHAVITDLGAGIVHADASGVLTSSPIVSADITDGTIVDADIAAAAAISPGKLAPQPFFVFLTTSTSNDKTGDGSEYDLVTDTERWDVGNTCVNGTFTVPGSGTQYWCFSASVSFVNVGAGHTTGQIGFLSQTDGIFYLSNQVSLAAIRTSSNIATLVIPAVVLAVNGGYSVKVACFAFNSTKTVGILGNANPLTWFSGYRVG